MTHTTADVKLACGCQLGVSTPSGDAQALLDRRVRTHVCGDRARARKAANARLRAAHQDEWNRYYVDALEGTR